MEAESPKETTVARRNFDTEIAKFTPRQMDAIRLLDSGKVKFLLYGGAMGGGKSYLLRWYALRRLLWMKRQGWNNAAVMLACEDYPSLKDRQLSKIEVEFTNQGFGKLHDDHKVYGRCWILPPEKGSGVICFRNLDDPSKYASAEFAAILVDELTKNSYEKFSLLRTRLRWQYLPDIEAQFVGGTNPGGVGHGWVKMLWIDRKFPDEFLKPKDLRSQFAYIPSKADDNPYLDESYWDSLNTLPEAMRKAYRDGDWNIYLGQAFPEFSVATHVIDPVPIPSYAPIYMTFDWGYGKPFHIGWWWVDADGRIYLFWEWYGWNGQPNQGIRLTDSAIAEGILQIERLMEFKDFTVRLTNKPILRLAGHDCWNKKPDYKGGGQGPSTAEIFANKGIFLNKADASRDLKLRQFRERLRVREDGKMPMLVVYKNCTEFIRTIAALPMDPLRIEQVDTTAEDHPYDSAAQICMARPIFAKAPKDRRHFWDYRIEQLQKPLMQDQFEFLAMREGEISQKIFPTVGSEFGAADFGVIQMPHDYKLTEEEFDYAPTVL